MGIKKEMFKEVNFPKMKTTLSWFFTEGTKGDSPLSQLVTAEEVTNVKNFFELMETKPTFATKAHKELKTLKR